MEKWRLVSEELPKENRARVWVYPDAYGRVSEAEFLKSLSGDMFRVNNDYGMFIDENEVTHWMPRPNPPKPPEV